MHDNGCIAFSTDLISQTFLASLKHVYWPLQVLIQSRYSTHRCTRNEQQKTKLLSSEFSGLIIDPILKRLTNPLQEPTFKDPRHCLVFWARPPGHVRSLAGTIQQRLLALAPSTFVLLNDWEIFFWTPVLTRSSVYDQQNLVYSTNTVRTLAHAAWKNVGIGGQLPSQSNRFMKTSSPQERISYTSRNILDKQFLTVPLPRHLTALEITHSLTDPEIHNIISALGPSAVATMTDYTYSHRARLIKPMLSYGMWLDWVY